MSVHFLRVLIFSLFTLFTFGNMSAKVLSVEEARGLASDFFTDGDNSRLADPSMLKLLHTAKNSAEAPVYYVFGPHDGRGFIIIAADDCVDPVIGYSYENAYLSDDMPDAATTMLANVATVISKSSKKPLRKTFSRATVGEKKELNTAPWSQEAPFNNSIPNRRLTGCVGVAMAAIMKHHNFPPKGNGSLGGVDFGVEYDWASMRNDNYRSGYNDTEANAVATLVSHAAQSIQTNFGMSSSSAFEVRVPNALINYFGYDAGVSYKKRSEMDKEAWDALLVAEIEAGRPVLYSGQDVSAGHAFVCDGYEMRGSTPYFRINWGWGGLANGYYASDALNPKASHNYNFNDQTTIVYNIKPSSSVIVWSPLHLTSDERQIGMTMDVNDLDAGTRFTVRAGALKNISNDNFSGTIAVALFNENGVMKTLLHEGKGLGIPSLQVLGSRYMDFSCSVPEGTLVEQGDELCLVTKANGADNWLPVAADLLVIGRIPAKGNEIPYFNIKMPVNVAGVEIECESAKVIKGRDFSFKVVASSPEKVVTVKANGFILTPDANGKYRIANVNSEQEISIIVQDAADVVAKRNLWVTAGNLSSIINDTDAGTIKDLTLFGSIDVNDFTFIRERMKLTRLDISGVNIVANGTNPANAIPAKAFSGCYSLKNIILPKNLSTLKSGCFNGCGLRSIEIPASVATYEYNIFLNCSDLSEVIVRRKSPAWINWCVFAGTPKSKLVVPVGASAAYSSKENWQDFKNKVEEDPVPATEYTVSIQDIRGVKITSFVEGTTVAPGEPYQFAVETDDSFGDATMEVYANNTRLYADSQGKYTFNVNDNTLLHINFKYPEKTTYDSSWKITDEKDGVGLVTDIVNVIPGKAFTIRANAMLIPKDDATMFYAAVLTDGKGGIKEIISPVVTNSYTLYGAVPSNFTCQVKEATVREGNLIRIATSYNKKTWHIVRAANPNVSDSIKAVGNEVVYHTVTMPKSVQGATIAGAVDQVVHGMPFSIKVTPVSVDDVITVSVNNELKAADVSIANISVPAVKDDLDIAIQVNPKGTGAYTVVNVREGELASKIQTCPSRLKVVGEILPSDFEAFRKNAAKIAALDLADVTIKGNGDLANTIPSNAFASSSVGVYSALSSIILPQTLEKIDASAFARCINLSEITIPASVESIGAGAFSSCIKLNKIIVQRNTPAVLGMNPFPSNSADITLEVPNGAENDYANASYWKDLKLEISKIYYNIQIDPTRVFNYNERYVLTKIEHPVKEYSVSLGLPNFPPKTYKKNPVYRPNVAFRLYDNNREQTNSFVVIDKNDPFEYTKVGQYMILFDTYYKDPAVSLKCPQNHLIEVVFYYPIKFNTPSGVTAEYVGLDEADVWKDVNMALFEEGSTERPTLYKERGDYSFRLSSVANMTPKVKVTGNIITTPGDEPVYSKTETVLAPDENGVYTIKDLQGEMTVDVTMVPSDGAVLESSEVANVDKDEASDIKAIGLTGDISDETFEVFREKFNSVETVDLSAMNNEIIPDNAFEGMEKLNSVVVSENVIAIGDKAFSKCPNLETITLNSVESIGANAFDGCEGLTSITINTRTNTSSVSRAPRTAGINDASFAGVNPNCLIFVSDAAIAASLSNVNVVYTGDSGNSNRHALTDIVLKSGYAFNTPGSFNLGDKTVSFEIPLGHRQQGKSGNWSGIVLPFSPSLISVEGVDYSIAENGKNTISVYSFGDSEDEELSNQQLIKPNVPYLARLNESGDGLSPVVFSAVGKNITPVVGSELTPDAFDVQTTPEESDIRCAGKDFTLYGSFSSREALAGDYVLDEIGANFVRLLDSDETVSVPLFSVYLKANTLGAPDSFAISRGESSGICDVEGFVTDGLGIYREGSVMVIMADSDRRVDIYDLNGRLVKSIGLTAGRNDVELPAGFYIVNGVKIIM